MATQTVDRQTLASKIEVLLHLPVESVHRQEDAEPIPEKLIGAKIIAFGAVDLDSRDKLGIEGGGLVIDYIPNGEVDAKRAVLSFNECGMWAWPVRTV